MGTKGICKNCKYWEQTGATDDGFVGECRRNAPLPGLSDTAPVGLMKFAVWPTTGDGQWCADFATRPLSDEKALEKLAMIEQLEAQRKKR